MTERTDHTTRPLAFACAISLLGTILWIALMLAGGTPPATFEQAFTKASRMDTVFVLSYLNVAFLVTVPVIALMALLHGFCKPLLSPWASRIAIVFVPIYGILNLTISLSQITVVPTLVDMARQPETRLLAESLLRLVLQELPGSPAAFFNGLAYAVLGIPSIVFGAALSRHSSRALKWAGRLLALNGAACILAVFGVLTHVPALQFGTIFGGGLFFMALLPMTWVFFAGRS